MLHLLYPLLHALWTKNNLTRMHRRLRRTRQSHNLVSTVYCLPEYLVATCHRQVFKAFQNADPPPPVICVILCKVFNKFCFYLSKYEWSLCFRKSGNIETAEKCDLFESVGSSPKFHVFIMLLFQSQSSHTNSIFIGSYVWGYRLDYDIRRSGHITSLQEKLKKKKYFGKTLTRPLLTGWDWVRTWDGYHGRTAFVMWAPNCA